MKHERIYLTADALKITQTEHDGLVALADDLAAGRIAHRPVEHLTDEEFDFITAPAPAEAFNMNYECGSACCIRGWLQSRGQLSPMRYVSMVAMDSLFYPCYPEWLPATWDAITPAQAAAAIRNFLSSGDPRWSEVVA